MRTLRVFLLVCAAGMLAACASAPPASASPGNFLDVGTVYPKFKGNAFYMATGQVQLYKYGLWGNLERTGKKVDVAVVIQVDPDSGKVERLAALQPRDGSSADRYAVEDLKGGILLTDFQPYPHWLDAVTEMEAADAKLNPAAPDYSSVSQSNGTVVFVDTPPVFRRVWWYRPHYHYFHRRRF